MLASDEMTPVKAWAPICWRPVKPSRPTSVPVKKAMLATTKNMPPPTIRAPAPMVMSETMRAISLRYRSAPGRARRVRAVKVSWS